jgi:hypothetical protein
MDGHGDDGRSDVDRRGLGENAIEGSGFGEAPCNVRNNAVTATV